MVNVLQSAFSKHNNKTKNNQTKYQKVHIISHNMIFQKMQECSLK